MLVLAATSPVPNDPQEPALLTLSEYLHRQNKDDKFHEDSSYDWGIERENSTKLYTQRYHQGSNRYSVNILPSGLVFFTDTEKQNRIVAYIKDDVLHYDATVSLREIPHSYRESPHYKAELIQLNWSSRQRDKYPDRFVNKVAKADLDEAMNKAYPVTLQHTKFKGQDFTIRAEKQPEQDKGHTLVVLNSDGYVVASASNEWGATLVHVVQEYRGFGIGPVLTELWYKYNPKFRSGGFTRKGRKQAARVWASRVRTFMANGWYSELVKEGKLSHDFVKSIIEDLSKVPQTPKFAQKPEDKGSLLVYATSTSFVFFNSLYLENQDDKYIYGYGFVRDSDTVGTFFYQLDWEDAYEHQTKCIAMQLAYDAKDRIYVGGEPSTVFDPSDVPGCVVENGYATQEKPLFNLKEASKTTGRVLAKASPYGELKDQLIEDAESKWH